MQELIEHIARKTGLTPEQAAAAAQAAVTFLKARLPSPVAGQLVALLMAERPEPGASSGEPLGSFGQTVRKA